MGAGGNLAFSLIFKLIDAATAPIRGIAAALAEPAQAAVAVGEAGEKGATRLGAGMDRAQGNVHRLGDAFKAPIARLAELGKAAGEAAEKFSRSFAGMGALVAEGFSIRDVAGQEEFWRRMQINTGMAGGAIEHLRGTIHGAVADFGISQNSMMDAFKSFKATGGATEVFEANARSIGAAIQIMGGHAEEVGKLFSTLQTRMHLERPEDFLNTTALIKKQLTGIDGGLTAFAEASDRLGDSMESLGMKGPQAAAALGAVYAVAAKGAGGNARKAMVNTEGWLEDLTHRGYRNQLSQGLGESSMDQNGRALDPRVLMRKMAEKYAEAMKAPENEQVGRLERLDELFGANAAKMFKPVAGEIKATGHSETLDRILGAKGDGADLMAKAGEEGRSLSGSMNKLRDSMGRAAESLFAGPLEVFANALSACGGVVGKVVIGLGALAMVGHTITWIAGAIRGFRLLQATLLTFRFAGIASGLASVASGFVPVIAASWAWAAAMLANPVTWIVLGVAAAIAVVGVAAYALWKNWDRIWGAIGGTVSAVWTGIQTGFSAFLDWLGDAFDGDLGTIVKAACAPILALAALPSLLIDHWSEIGDFFRGLWTGVVTGLKDHLVRPVTAFLAGLFEPVAALGASIKDTLGGAWDWVGAKCAEMVDWVARKLDPLFDKLKMVKDWLADTTRPAREAVKGAVKGAVATVAHSAPVKFAAGIADKAINSLEMGARTKQAVTFFEGKGWSHAQAAGIAASLKAESGFNSGAVGDSGHAYGLGQWHEDRQAAFAQWAGHDIKASKREEQLGFVNYELRQGNERAAGQALAQTSTAAEAGAVVSKRYERPADREGEAARRSASAEAIAAAVPKVAVNDNAASVAAAVPSSAPVAAAPQIPAPEAAPAATIAPAPQPLSRADLTPSAPPKSDGIIVVRFENLPKGVTPTVKSQPQGLSLQLDRGPSMAAG